MRWQWIFSLGAQQRQPSSSFITLLQVKIIYKQVCREASAAMMVHQLFLSIEFLLHSTLWFSLLKTLLGLNFPLDLLSSFSRSFCKPMERCQENTRFWQVNMILQMLQNKISKREEHRLIERRRFQKQSHIPTFVLYCGFKKPILSSLPSKIKIKLHLHKGRNIKVKVKCFFFPSGPLHVLVQAVDDLVPLVDDGHQLIHQLLLFVTVLLSPVTLWVWRQQECLKRSPYHSEITIYQWPDL